MDWVISVTFDDDTIKSRHVYWDKGDDTSHVSLSSNLLNNQAFWLNNSSQLTTMINDTFANICGYRNVVYLVKQESRWSLLVHSESNIKTIHFNDAMKQYFGFNYIGSTNAINIERIDTFNINDIQYWRITTPYSTNKLFLFNKLIFKSNNLEIPSINIQTNSTSVSEATYNTSESVILSYDLLVSDISSVSASMSYTSNEKDRSLSLQSSVIKPFTITPYFVTKDGQEFPIILKNGDSASISMMFYKNENNAD